MMETTAVEVKVRHKLTQNAPHNDLFIEVDDLHGNPVAAFTSPRQASVWLAENNFRYVGGTSGIWTRKKDSLISLDFLDGRAMTNRQLYKRPSLFSVGNIMLTLALCAFVYVLLG
jgi:hypothetical protein